MNRHPNKGRMPGKRSISNEALIEGLQNVDGLAPEDADFVTQCAAAIESSSWLDKPDRDRLVAIGKRHGVVGTPASAKHRPRTGSFAKVMEDGADAYDQLVEQAREALTRRPHMRRVG